MKTPLVAICSALTAGMAVGIHRLIPDIPALSLLLALLVILYGVHRAGKERAALACLAAAWFVLGIITVKELEKPHDLHGTALLLSHAEGRQRQDSTIEGYIVNNPRVMVNKTRFVLSVAALVDDRGRRPADGRILVTVRNGRESFRYGDYIRFTAHLKKPRNFNNPGRFDYEGHLRRQGILLSASVNRPGSILLLRRGGGNPVLVTIEAARRHLRSLIDCAAKSPERELLAALIIGEKERIQPAIRDRFNRTGVAHILAISGFHIGMVGFFSFFFIRIVMSSWSYLLLKGNLLKLSACLSLPVVVAYALLSGFGVSTIRAALMTGIFVLSILLSRTGTLLNTLALAAMTILILWPAALFNVSFQLSFTAVAAILMVLPPVLPLLSKRFQHRRLEALLIFFVVTITATIATAPLIAFYFNRLSTVAILSNALIVPLVGFIILPLGLTAAFLALPLPSMASSLFSLAGAVLSLVTAIITRLETMPLSSFSVPTPGLFEVACFYGACFMAVKWIDALRHGKGRRLIPATLFLLVTAGIVHGACLARAGIPAGRLEMTCLDVGQGSAALVTFPDRSVMLVDGGGFFDPAFDVGKNILAPYLHQRRIRFLDVVVLTHPDQDHIGGLPYILETFSTGEVWSNGDASPGETYRRFMDIIARRGLPHQVLWNKSPHRTRGGAVIEVISPRQGDRNDLITSGCYDFNRFSLVLRITFGEVSFLLTGDLTGGKEDLLVREGAPLKSLVMQVPHHGSELSSRPDFIRAVNPSIAVISAGFNNPFGFPRPEVLERYEEAGVSLYRTDISGAVTVSTDGREVSASCFLPCR